MMAAKEKIRNKRPPLFQRLQVYQSGDLVIGSWYIVAGSFFAALIPIFPLISIYLEQQKRFWPTFGEDVMTISAKTVVYVLLVVGVGIFTTIGSYLTVRFMRSPRDQPCLNCGRWIPNDEVHSMIWFAIGNVSTIPIMAIYVYYYPTSKEFAGALFICALTSCISLAIVPYCYPKEDGAIPYKNRIAPLLHSWRWCAPGTSWHYHLATDWLIVAWVAFWATAFSIGACLACFAWYIHKRDNRGMFDYSTSCFDFLLFLIGNVYILAGSYESEDSSAEGQEAKGGDGPDPEVGPVDPERRKPSEAVVAPDKLQGGLVVPT
jgi:hypothetical protein